MVNQSADRELQARVDVFVADLTELVRQAALQAVQDALGVAAVVPSRGRKRVASAGKATAKKPARRKSGKRVRRSTDDLAVAGQALVVEVRRAPGSGFEALRAALGVDGKDLRRPLNDLLESGAIRKEGAKRGTKYYPAGTKSAAKPAKKKAAKRKTAKRKATKRKATKGKTTKRKATKRKVTSK